MAITAAIRTEAASRPGASKRVPRLLLAAVFAVACAVIAYVGVPAPEVSSGERAPRTFVARTRFTYVDPVETHRRKQIARDRALSVYVEKPGWRSDALRTVVELLRAAEESPDPETATARLEAEGIDIDPAPVWKALRAGPSPPAEARRQVLGAVERLVDELASEGVIDDEKMDAEIRSGRLGIVRSDRQVVLGGPGRKGVLGLSAAHEKAAAGLRAAFPADPALAGALAMALRRDLGPSLVFHRERTSSNRDSAAATVEEVRVAVSEGDVIVRQGRPVGTTEYEMLLREAQAYYSTRPLSSHLLRLAGVLVLVGGGVGLLGALSLRLEPGALDRSRTILLVGLMDLVVVGSARALAVTGMPVMLSPVALAAILLALAVSPLFAVLNSAVVALPVTLATGQQLSVTVSLCAGAVVGALAVARSRRRSDLLRAGALAGIAQLVAVVGVELAAGVEEPATLLELGGWALLNGFGCGLLGLGILPVAEVAFGVTTDISLLELSDQNHPMLRRLLLEAPGTYHHSLIVGNLSEGGALAVGAKALLARVASYYHDIGKVDRPEYFIENEPPGRSRHEGLSPTMSTLIITSHVRDGVTLAAQHRLPKAIVDIIAQHHGTSLVEFFYRTAVERASGEKVDERLFRYPGPKPQTKEAAIVLLADSVEAASRALEEPTSARLSKLVRDLTMKRLLDGQFDESGLTLRDLRILHDSFVKVLTSMFHSRVPYPVAGTSAAKWSAASSGARGGR